MIDGSVLTLSTADGEMAVNTTADTIVQRSIAGVLADLQVGQFLSVTGAAEANGDITASSVAVTTRAFGAGSSPRTGSPPDGGMPGPPSGTPAFSRPTGVRANGASGTITEISGNRVILSSPQGQQVTVIVKSDATIEMTIDASLADLRVGLAVTVSGRQNAQGSIDAFAITISR